MRHRSDASRYSGSLRDTDRRSSCSATIPRSPPGARVPQARSPHSTVTSGRRTLPARDAEPRDRQVRSAGIVSTTQLPMQASRMMSTTSPIDAPARRRSSSSLAGPGSPSTTVRPGWSWRCLPREELLLVMSPKLRALPCARSRDWSRLDRQHIASSLVVTKPVPCRTKYDALETRDPAVREREQFARLPDLGRAGDRPGSGWAKQLTGVDPKSRHLARGARESCRFFANPICLRPPAEGQSAVRRLQPSSRRAGRKRLHMSPGPIFEPEGHGALGFRRRGARALRRRLSVGDVVHTTRSPIT